MPWHNGEEKKTWKIMGIMSQMRKFSGLTGPVFNARSTIKPAGENWLGNRCLQFCHEAGSGCCCVVEEYSGWCKVNVSLGLKCAQLSGSMRVFKKSSKKK